MPITRRTRPAPATGPETTAATDEGAAPGLGSLLSGGDVWSALVDPRPGSFARVSSDQIETELIPMAVRHAPHALHELRRELESRHGATDSTPDPQ